MSDDELAVLTLVLSNGHCAMFLYVLKHLTGYEAWTMDELKGYGSAKKNGYTTLAHGHPEIKCPGVEVTTGPLGQEIANAVGLAIAPKTLAAQYNQPGYDIVQFKDLLYDWRWMSRGPNGRALLEGQLGHQNNDLGIRSLRRMLHISGSMKSTTSKSSLTEA